MCLQRIPVKPRMQKGDEAMEDEMNKEPLSDDELGTITGGAGLQKNAGLRPKKAKMIKVGAAKTATAVRTAAAPKQMMDITCTSCGKTYSANVLADSSNCPYCTQANGLKG